MSVISWCILISLLVIVIAIVWLLYRVNQIECELEVRNKQMDGNFRYIISGMSTYANQLKRLEDK